MGKGSSGPQCCPLGALSGAAVKEMPCPLFFKHGKTV